VKREHTPFDMIVKISGDESDEIDLTRWVKRYVNEILRQYREGKEARMYYHWQRDDLRQHTPIYASRAYHSDEWVRDAELILRYLACRKYLSGQESIFWDYPFNTAWPLVLWDDVVDLTYRVPHMMLPCEPGRGWAALSISSVIELLTGYYVRNDGYSDPSHTGWHELAREIDPAYKGNKHWYYYDRDIVRARLNKRETCAFCGRLFLPQRWGGDWTPRCDKYCYNLLGGKLEKAGVGNKGLVAFDSHDQESLCSQSCHRKMAFSYYEVVKNHHEEGKCLKEAKDLLRETRRILKTQQASRSLKAESGPQRTSGIS